MIAPGAIAPRRDTDHELYVVVLSNAVHLEAGTGRVITCPFIPGQFSGDAMAMAIVVPEPEGTVLPELVQWLPIAALDDSIGNIGSVALHETIAIVTALVS